MNNDTANAKHLIQNIYTSVLVFDNKLRLIGINASAENLLSVSQRKVAGQTAYEILPASPHFAETIARALKMKHPYTERSVELKPPNTNLITVDFIVTPLVDDDESQEVIVELINTQSLTRVIREENLSVLHDAARESLQGMAHEIKNPLGGLRGAAQLLEQELMGSELTEYTNIIINEADRLQNLVDRMLAPRGKVCISRINIHEVLQYVHDLVEAESNNRLNIERDYDPSLPDFEADREQLIQAVLNIFRNAVQAIDEDGQIWIQTRIKRKCTIRQQYYKLAVQIEIIDDGPGVPAEIEGGIFYPLVTGRAEGTGLGLSIAQSLIQLHGGLIEHERIKHRTVFRIILPIRIRND